MKTLTALSVVAAALVAGACSDDDDDSSGDGGTGGTSKAGSAGSAGKANAGSSNGGSSNGGTANGGSANAGTTNGGTTNGGTTNGGTTNGGTAGNGGDESGGAGGDPAIGGSGGEPGGTAGDGAGGQPGSAGGGGEGGATFLADVLENPGFNALAGWTNEGTAGAAYVEGGGRTGNKLTHWITYVAGTDFTVSTFQTVGPIPNGTYSFSIYVDRGYEREQYLFARGFNAADLAQQVTMDTTAANTPDGFVQVTLSGIVVTNEEVTVGVYTSTESGTYCAFDDAELTLQP